VVKWAGGKQMPAAYLVQRFPKDFDKYYEPFVGALRGRRLKIELSHLIGQAMAGPVDQNG
jgi:hypothetical protein